MVKVRQLILTLLMASAALVGLLGAAQVRVERFARVDPATLSGSKGADELLAYSLSPDGSRVAVVHQRLPSRQRALAIVDLMGGSVLAEANLGSEIMEPRISVPQALYSPDGKFVTVNDLRTARVFTADGLSLAHTFTSPFPGGDSTMLLSVVGASASPVVACAFSNESDLLRFDHEEPNPTPHRVRVVMANVATGEKIATLTLDDVPQALSPDGRSILASSAIPKDRVLPIALVDVGGTKRFETTAGYRFTPARRASDPVALGRVRGRFLSDSEVLLVPDDAVDQSGNASGTVVQIGTIDSNGSALRILARPPKFRSMGEVAVAGNGQRVAVLNHYVPSLILAEGHEHDRFPANSHPELLVFDWAGSNWTQLAVVTLLGGHGLVAVNWQEYSRPQLSSDGSILAYAERGAIVALKLPPHR
jgi:hypothetical protein